jgi:hypothetical protein
MQARKGRSKIRIVSEPQAVVRTIFDFEIATADDVGLAMTQATDGGGRKISELENWLITSHPKTSKNAIYDIENANNGGFGMGSS